ncbi:MAG: AAA family ATPase [Treponema sp.]|nr:AAA family ATPase [Treponema sp.]
MEEDVSTNVNNNEEYYTGVIIDFVPQKHIWYYGRGLIEGSSGRISFYLRQVSDFKLEKALYNTEFDKSTIVKYKKGVTSKGQIVADDISIDGEKNKKSPYYLALEPYDSSENNYFDKAWEYEYGSKNLEEAIKYYKLAIRLGQKIPNAVKRIAEIYKKQDKKKEALEILNKYKNYMTEAKYLNTKFSILIKNPEIAYLNELTDTYEKVLNVNDDNITLQHQYANAITIFNKYDEAIKIHQDIINKQNTNVAQKKISMQALCQIEQKRNNKEEVKKWAEEILKLVPTDAFAQTILSGGKTSNVSVSLISDTVNNVFSIGKLENNINSLQGSVEAKNEIENTFLNIFNNISKYMKTSDYDSKYWSIHKAEEELQELENKIQKKNAEQYMDSLSKLKNSCDKEYSDFMRDTIPEIDVSVAEGSVNVEGNIIQFVLNIQNNNKQTADNVVIKLSKENFEIIQDYSQEKNILKGSSAIEKIFKIQINDEKLLKEDVLPLRVIIQYDYSIEIKKTEEDEIEKEITLSLEKQEFEPIENKYAAYADGSVVKDDTMFFGRDDDIKQIIANIYGGGKLIKTGRTLALYGQMRTGKSSLLEHLEKALREKDSEKNIIIHFGDISKISGDLYSFCSWLLFNLQKELEDNHPILYKELNNAGITIDDSLPQEHYLLQFNKLLERFCKFINRKASGYNLILTIDEFTLVYDSIRNGVLTEDFMMFWKAFIQDNAIYAIILCQDHMMKFVNDIRFTNAFGSIGLRKVTYLSEKYAKDLMEKPILYHGKSRYKQGALDRLYELTSGSAYLIMKICCDLVNFINDEIHVPYITKAYIDECLKKKLPEIEEEKYFHPLFIDKSDLQKEDAIKEKNKFMLKRIAQQSSRNEWADYKKVVLSDEDEEILKNLEERDVVIVEERQRCKIKITLYKEWLLRKYGDN